MSREQLIDTWVCAAALADSRRGELARLVDASRATWGGAPAVAAALLWKQYAWYLVDTALCGWFSGSVPDLALDVVEVRFRGVAPHVEVRAPGVLEVPARSDVEFARWFGAEVVKGHLTPVLESLHDLTRAGSRLLWGSVAHALAEPLAERMPEPARTVPALLSRLGPPLDGLIEVGTGGAAVVRRTCCLAFRCDDPVICGYCPIRRADCAPLARQVF
ncbi:hypothetical protein [Flindersiella endophytica]